MKRIASQQMQVTMEIKDAALSHCIEIDDLRNKCKKHSYPRYPSVHSRLFCVIDLNIRTVEDKNKSISTSEPT
jgi:hypothetical protein